MTLKDEISFYDGERYLYARKIAEAVADHLERIGKDKKNKFAVFLSKA